MSTSNMDKRETVEVKAKASRMPEPMDLEESTPNPPAQAPKDTTARASSSRGKRGRQAKELAQNEDLLMQISWSRQRQPEIDLPTLIEEGRVDLERFDRQKAEWVQAGNLACVNCQKAHAPPCMSREEANL
jgi:hypothetical protein